jgi:hypothetical protein
MSLNYALGLADAMLSKGGKLFENTEVSSIEGRAAPPSSWTIGQDSFACNQIVIVACNAYLGSNWCPGSTTA